MKLKYFFRGLGLGIFITAVILSISYNTQLKQQRMTDEEIIARAQTLGMMMPDEEKDQEETLKPSNTPKPSESPKPSNTPKPSESPKPSDTPKPSESPKPSDTPKPSKSPDSSKDADNYITVSIEKGMWSDAVSRLLENSGLIKDAVEFDNFLADNDYATYIAIGTYKIKEGATYDEIARQITKK